MGGAGIYSRDPTWGIPISMYQQLDVLGYETWNYDTYSARSIPG